jgi:hypothetical protein
MASTSYQDNWEHFRYLNRLADQTRNQYEVARAAHAAAETGSIERVQLEGVALQKKTEAQVAENALNAFKQEVQQSQPEQARYMEMGIAPEGVRMAEATEVMIDMAPAIAGETLSPDFLNGSGISALEVAKDSVEAIKNVPDYLEGKLNSRTDQQIADAPAPLLDSEVRNAVTDEVQKTELAASRQHELNKLQQQHTEQTAKQDAQLAKFMESQAEKPADVQAKQAELAEKARAELAAKQEQEMKAKIAELERSKAEALEAQARARALEHERNRSK